MTYLVAAYSVFFVLVFVYTLRMGARQKSLQQRVADLERNIRPDRKD